MSIALKEAGETQYWLNVLEIGWYLEDYKNSDEISNELNLSKSFINKYLGNSYYRRNKSAGVSVGLVRRYRNIPYMDYLNNIDKFYKYELSVIKITKKQPIETLPNFENRGNSGVDGAYHLDHKFSIIQGFINNIPPEIIGNIKNLEFIPWLDNIKKRTKCSISINELNNIKKWQLDLIFDFWLFILFFISKIFLGNLVFFRRNRIEVVVEVSFWQEEVGGGRGLAPARACFALAWLCCWSVYNCSFFPTPLVSSAENFFPTKLDRISCCRSSLSLISHSESWLGTLDGGKINVAACLWSEGWSPMGPFAPTRRYATLRDVPFGSRS